MNISKSNILVAGNEVTTNEVTGASVMWKPASIFLAATLFLFLLF